MPIPFSKSARPSPSREPDASPGLVAGVTFAVLYTAYALALRIADTADLLAAGAIVPTPFGPPFSLPLLLGEELAVGALLGTLVGAAWRRAFARAAILVVLGGYLLLLAAEQLAFDVFFSHIDYVLYADTHDLAGLAGSIEGLLDASFFVEVALALGVVAAVALPWRPALLRALARRLAHRPRVPVAAAAAYLGITVGLGTATQQHGLDRPFPIAFAASYLRARAEESAEARAAAAPPPPTIASRALRRGEDAPAADELAPVRDALAAYPGKLNVVWYLMESTSYRETSLDPSQAYDTTPFLKRLARESLVFTRYHAGVAASTRSFFSIQTGLDPYMDEASDLTKYSQLVLPTLVDTLHDAGWATAFFSSSDTMFESLDTFLGARKYDEYMDKNLVPAASRKGMSIETWGVDEEIVIDEALEWISETRGAGKPYFVSYNAVYPHHPFNVPAAHRDLFDMDWGDKLTHARYRASLRYADTAVERMYDGLEKLGALDDTLFIVSPDHGEAFGDLHRKNSMHAEYCYEDDTHIFLILRNPKALGPPRATDRLGSHVDMFPTLLDALGVNQPPGVDGQSLVSAQYREPILHCFSRRQLAVRDGDTKAISSREDDAVELYDLAGDPTEQRDLEEKRPDEARKYAADLFAWKARAAQRMRDRVTAAGLTAEEIANRALRRRQELFSKTRLVIQATALCASASAGACAAGKRRSFAPGQALSAWVQLQKAGKTDVRLEVFDPSGKKIFAKKAPLEDGEEAALGPVPGELLSAPGRYKARISLVQSYAVHDFRVLPFDVGP
jgi:arylsulfatase A-like enzyme